MKKKNEIYVLKQPTKAIATIVVVDTEFPLNSSIQDNIDKLNKVSDIIFMFSDTFNKHSEGIDKNKFSSLYEASAWIEEGGSVPETFFKILRYCREIFDMKFGYGIIGMSDLCKEFPIDDIVNNISRIKTGDINNLSYFNIERHSREFLYELYKLPPKKSFFKKLLPERNKISPELAGMFCTYRSNSKYLYLNNSLIENFLRFQDEDVTKQYIKSFQEEFDIRYLVASLVKYLGIDVIEKNLETL